MPTAADQVNSAPVSRLCKIGCHVLKQVMASAGHFPAGDCVLQQCDMRHTGSYPQSAPLLFRPSLSAAPRIDPLV